MSTPISCQGQCTLSLHFGEAIMRTVQSYQDFASRDAPDSAKEFGAHHSACKAALAHLEALLKLNTHNRTPSTAEKTTSPDLDTLLQQARTILTKHDT